MLFRSQPNITSVGTLTSLSVSGNISGTLSTAAQPNITSVGNLTSLTVTGNSTLGNTVTGNYFVGDGSLVTGIVLDQLTDVQLTSPAAGQALVYNGNLWVNGSNGSSSIGQGVGFWLVTPVITATSANNAFQIDTLGTAPNTSTLVTTVTTTVNNTTAVIAAWESSSLNRISIDRKSTRLNSSHT